MQVFKFKVCFVNHQGIDEEKVITVKEETGNLELAKNKAEISIKTIPTDRALGSLERATSIEVKTIQLIND